MNINQNLINLRLTSIYKADSLWPYVNLYKRGAKFMSIFKRFEEQAARRAVEAERRKIAGIATIEAEKVGSALRSEQSSAISLAQRASDAYTDREVTKAKQSISSLQSGLSSAVSRLSREEASTRQSNQSISQLQAKWAAVERAEQEVAELRAAAEEAGRMELAAIEQQEQNAAQLVLQQELELQAARQIAPYEPNIQPAVIFPAEDIEGKFSAEHSEIIQTISSRICEGNDRIAKEKHPQAILLIGNTGAGKSTLAHALSGRGLQGIVEDETGELLIDALHPTEDIVIGHQMTSETTIPNKCRNGETVVWDCPGSNDTQVDQEFPNIFYIKRLLEMSQAVRLVLVVPEPNIVGDKGSKFVETIKYFMNSFDAAMLGNSVSLVVSKVAPHKRIDHIKNSIDKVLTQNQQVTDEMKAFVGTLLESSSVHLFYRPRDEGVMPSQANLLAAIEADGDYVVSDKNLAKLTVSQPAQEYSHDLLQTVSGNFNNIVNLMINAVADSTNCMRADDGNLFTKNHAMIARWVPDQMSYDDLRAREELYFLNLDMLTALKGLFESPVITFEEGVAVLRGAMQIFERFVDNDEAKQQMQEYAYVLNQQFEYIKFFSEFIEEPEAQIYDLNALQAVIAQCWENIATNFEYQVKTIELEPGQGAAYYKKAIFYLDQCDHPVCATTIAQAHMRIAELVVGDDVPAAIEHYVAAIGYDKTLAEVYEQLGQLFQREGEYSKAIECWKVVGKAYAIKNSFDAWLENAPENVYAIMMVRGGYCEYKGRVDDAVSWYNNAASVAVNLEAAKQASSESERTLSNAKNIRDEGAARVREMMDSNFCNYSMVTPEFVESIADGIVIAGGAFEADVVV
ncbi:MAG: hypothetical protein COA94_03160 [Rickettsiales bacterium]|nr:MAG: hypothetical protein COA94_03160 [Rickettsiales bacterium]